MASNRQTDQQLAKPPYNVNLASEVALLASLDDRPGLMERVHSIVAERDRMMDLLKQISGVTPWPSRANFILCKLPEGRGQEIFEGFCRKGIFLRYWNTPHQTWRRRSLYWPPWMTVQV